MEKPPPEKSVSFSKKKNDNVAVSSPRQNLDAIDEKSDGLPQSENDIDFADFESDPDLIVRVLDDVDRFLECLPNAAEEDDSNLPPEEVPIVVESLSRLVESMVVKYNAASDLERFGRDSERDHYFTEAVNRISLVSNKLAEFPSNPTTASSLNRTSAVLQRAMSFFDEELHNLLEEPKTNNESDHKSNKTTTKQSSFSSNNEPDRCEVPESETAKVEEFPAYLPETVSNMNKISTTMISACYDHECCMIYSNQRRTAFKTALNKLGYDLRISIDDIQRMPWESLETEIATWINVIKHCSNFLFPGERKLSDSVFSDHSSISQSLFCNLARAVVLQLLNFADAVVLTKRSAEKLFKFLDMYETLRDLIPTITDFPEECANELESEIEGAKSRIGEAAISIFCDLENSIKSDNGRTPVPSGAVHPLTRYIMNYLKYACEYKDTLEQVFQQQPKNEETTKDTEAEYLSIEKENNYDGSPTMSPFALQLMTVMDLLDANLDAKSKLYKDLSLRYIFLMNNGRYIVQKIKGSSEIHELMGDNWCRKRSSILRQYHKGYQRETWGKILQCLNHEGLQVNGKVSKAVLKERFKNFNAMFDEIHKTQSSWVVSDEQLQSELRVSVSAVMIPAYRSFIGRFKQYLEQGRQAEKYIKYQPEDIETSIDELFDGNPMSMARRRT